MYMCFMNEEWLNEEKQKKNICLNQKLPVKMLQILFSLRCKDNMKSTSTLFTFLKDIPDFIVQIIISVCLKNVLKNVPKF